METKKSKATGDMSFNPKTKIIDYKMGDYNVAVKVDENNQFVGIDTISVNQKFYDYRSVNGEHDVAKYYQD